MKASTETYKTINVVLDKRFQLINPVIIDFIKHESEFFSKTASVLRRLDSLEANFKNISYCIIKEESNYDPGKYIRGGDIIKINPTSTKTVIVDSTTASKDDDKFRNNVNSYISTIPDNLKNLNNDKKDPAYENFSNFNNTFSNSNLNSNSQSNGYMQNQVDNSNINPDISFQINKNNCNSNNALTNVNSNLSNQGNFINSSNINNNINVNLTNQSNFNQNNFNENKNLNQIIIHDSK